MGKNKLILELLCTYTSDFKPGQSLGETIKQINERFFYPRHDDKDLLALARLMNPEYVITAQDRAEMAKRRALSDQTRDQVFRFIHKRAELKANTKMSRGLEMLLDFSDDPRAAAHNKRVLHAFAMDDSGNYLHNVMEERTKIMEEFIDKMENEYDMTQYYGLSDRELAAKFPAFFPYFLLAQEGGNAILTRNNDSDKHYNLSEEYVKKLQNFRDFHQSNMSAVVSRFNMIIDPNYEILHYERIEPDANHNPAFVLEDEDNPFIAKMKRQNRELTNLAYTINQFHGARGLSWEVKIYHHLKQHGMDIRNAEVYDSDGQVRNYKELYGLDRTGLLRVRDNSSGKEFLLQSNGVELLSVDPMKAPAILEKKTKDLVKAMDDADPWRIRAFTGSQAYANMKAAMKAVAQMRETLPQNPDPNQRVYFNQELRHLLEKCEAYLKTKNPLSDTTTESERLRINAANDAIRYAKETMVLMSAQEKLLKERGTDEIEADAKADSSPAAKRLWKTSTEKCTLSI